MKQITVKFTTAELTLLSTLAADQLFRREFIDVRLPGYNSSAAEISLGKQLVERLRLLTKAPTIARSDDRVKPQRDSRD